MRTHIAMMMLLGGEHVLRHLLLLLMSVRWRMSGVIGLNELRLCYLEEQLSSLASLGVTFLELFMVKSTHLPSLTKFLLVFETLL
jgi:hypothetical protein